MASWIGTIDLQWKMFDANGNEYPDGVVARTIALCDDGSVYFVSNAPRNIGIGDTPLDKLTMKLYLTGGSKGNGWGLAEPQGLFGNKDLIFTEKLGDTSYEIIMSLPQIYAELDQVGNNGIYKLYPLHEINSTNSPQYFHSATEIATRDNGCGDNDDCPEGQKCVDGDCVDCDQQQATHFQVRFEYSELATDSAGLQSMYHLSSVIPIAGAEELVIQGTEVNQSKYYPRIRFCDSEGNIKPYTGTFSFYGFCTPDKAWALYPSNGNLTETSSFIGAESQTDAVSNNPWFVPRVLINHMDESAVIHETDCSSVTPEEPPDIETVFPEEPIEPDEPTQPEEPTEPTEPTKPNEPDAPETGCECEIYIGEQIARAANILYDGIILLKRELSVGFREVVVEMYEARKLNYELSRFLQNQQYQALLTQHQRLYQILQTLQKGLIKGDDGLIDIVKTGLVEGDDGLVDIVKTGLVEEEIGLVDYAKDFIEQYEPVTIENEYRTQSHRVIDNLDEVVNKL